MKKIIPNIISFISNPMKLIIVLVGLYIVGMVDQNIQNAEAFGEFSIIGQISFIGIAVLLIARILLMIIATIKRKMNG